MSLSNTFENDLMLLIFNGTAIADIAENDSSGPLTAFYWALHTATPDEAGVQTTNEIGYTSYDRVSVNRSTGAGGHTVSGNSMSPGSNVDFPTGGGGSGTATHFSIGVADLPTAGKILFYGTVTPNIVCGNGVTPRLTTATTCTMD